MSQPHDPRQRLPCDHRRRYSADPVLRDEGRRPPPSQRGRYPLRVASEDPATAAGLPQPRSVFVRIRARRRGRRMSEFTDAEEAPMRVEIILGGWRSGRTRRFVRHLLEMTVAMVLGMCVLGAAFREIHLALFGTGFEGAWHRHVELTAFAMAFNMTLPMVAWMRHRGRSWQRSGEMAAAMFVPPFALIALFWLGAIQSHVLLPLQMGLMLPSM